jgi:hypothetical protein
MLVILATEEAEIRRIMVPSQPSQRVQETLSRENPLQKRAGGVAEGIFKPQVNSSPSTTKRRKEKKYILIIQIPFFIFIGVQ